MPPARVSLKPRLWQTAKIEQIIIQSPRVKSFVLKPTEAFDFTAGQHAEVRLTAPDGYRAQRSYSISSAPEEHGTFELTVERLDDGEVSPYFHEVAAVGDEVEVRGPLGGHFIWDIPDGGPVLLIGGGSGVCPLISMARHRQRQGSDVPMMLLFSARTWEEVLFRDELLAMRGRERLRARDHADPRGGRAARRLWAADRCRDACRDHAAAAGAAEACVRLRVQPVRRGCVGSGDCRRSARWIDPDGAVRGLEPLGQLQPVEGAAVAGLDHADEEAADDLAGVGGEAVDGGVDAAGLGLADRVSKKRRPFSVA